MAVHSEVQLEIAELDVEGLAVRGSLIIRAEHVMGHVEKGLIHYSEQTGKCRLKNVTIENLGIDRSATRNYWKNEIVRSEQCEILIHGNGEFIAEDVTLSGDRRIIVENGYRVTATEQEGKIILIKEVIQVPSWSWQYRLDGSQIIINK